MKRLLSLNLLFGLLLGASLSAQTSDADRRSLLLSAKSDLLQLEIAQLKAQGAAEQARFLDVGEATLKALESAIPASREEFERLLQGDDGLLKNDAGRFHAQNPEVVKTVRRYVTEARFQDLLGLDPDELDETRIDFGENERKKRIEIVKAAIGNIKREPAGAFDPSTSPSVVKISENAAWAARVFEVLVSRNTLLESYIDTFPAGTDVSDLPTLDEAVNASLVRSFEDREALLNEVDAQNEKERAERMAEAERQFGQEKLEAELKKAAARHEGELLKMGQQLQELIEQTKAQQAQHAQEMAQARAEFDRVIARQALEIEKLQAAAAKDAKMVQAKQKTRELPANTRLLLSGLSAKGTWKPSKPGGNPRALMGTSSQYGLDPQPHSLGTLAGIGALEDTPVGVYTMNGILAFKGDTARPRSDAGFAHSQNLASYYWFTQTETSELNKHPEGTKRIREIQALIREFGEELVEQGYLAP